MNKRNYTAPTIPQIIENLEKQKGIRKVLYSRNENRTEVRFNIFFDSLINLADAIEKINHTPKEFHATLEEKPYIATLVYR